MFWTYKFCQQKVVFVWKIKATIKIVLHAIGFYFRTDFWLFWLSLYLVTLYEEVLNTFSFIELNPFVEYNYWMNAE